MTTFYTSDQHLGHENIRKFEPGRLALGDSVDEMNESMIRLWNEIVTDDDTVYVLGDWAMGRITDSLALTSRFNGRKRLIVGNHDRSFPHGADRKWDHVYLDAGFEWVVHGPIPHTDTYKVRLSHFPLAPAGEYDARYADHHPEPEPGTMLLHGHVHSAWKFKPGQINVGCDVWDYKPRTLIEMLDEYMAYLAESDEA